MSEWPRRRIAHRTLTALLVLASARSFAGTRTEFWPDAHFYARLTPRTRLFLLASLVRSDDPKASGEARVYRDVQFGAHLDVTLKPILRHRLREADWERERYLWVRIGYRYGTSLGKVANPYREHRGILELTGRAPLPAGFWTVNRGHIDLRDVDGEQSQRYRYRLGFEREVTLRGTAVVPFVSAEVFYDSRFGTVNRQRYQLGAEVVLSPHWRVEPSFIRQEDQRSEPAHLNAVGLSLKYYL